MGLLAELTITASPVPCIPRTYSSARPVGCVRLYLDVLGPVSVLEGVVRVVEEDVGRVDVCDHDQAAPPLQRGLEQVGQLAVAVLHVSSPLYKYSRHIHITAQAQTQGRAWVETDNGNWGVLRSR